MTRKMYSLPERPGAWVVCERKRKGVQPDSGIRGLSSCHGGQARRKPIVYPEIAGVGGIEYL